MLQITQLAYVDDLLLFARGDASFVSIMVNNLEQFDDMANLHANQLKFMIYLVGVDEQVKDALP